MKTKLALLTVIALAFAASAVAQPTLTVVNMNAQLTRLIFNLPPSVGVSIPPSVQVMVINPAVGVDGYRFTITYFVAGDPVAHTASQDVMFAAGSPNSPVAVFHVDAVNVSAVAVPYFLNLSQAIAQ